MRSPVGRALLGALLCLAVATVPAPSSASAATLRAPAPHTAPSVAPSKLPHGLGAVPPGVHVDAARFPGGAGRRAFSLPVSADLSANAPAIGDQGQLGSCGPWAIGYSILGYYAKTQPHTGAPFAALSLYNVVNGGRDGGSTSSAIYAALESKGIVEQSVWTHGRADYTSRPNAAEAANALTHRTSGGTVLFYQQNQGTAARTAIETALAAGDPVAIGMPVYLPFEYLTPTDSVMTPVKASGADLGGHMVAAYGYDATGVKIANSWGTAWGKAGWATLSWDFVDRYVFEATTPGAFVKATVPAAPVVTAVAPRTLLTSGGTTIFVKGSNLAGTTGVALVNAADPSKVYRATLTSASATDLTATVPAVPGDGAYRVVVTAAGGSSAETPADDVRYVKPVPLALAPGTKVAATGGTVTVTGSGFGSSASDLISARITATVAGKPARVAWLSDTAITVSVPAGAPGTSVPLVVLRQGLPSGTVTVPYATAISRRARAVRSVRAR